LLSVISRLFGRGGDDLEEVDPSALEQMADEELMLRFSQGDHAAFALLLDRHEGKLFRYIYRFVHERPLAEDLTQEVFLRVCKAAPRYKKKAKFTTWLFTIARNLCIDKKRRRSKRTEISMDSPRDGGGGANDDDRALMDLMPETSSTMASSKAVRAEFLEQLEAALGELPDEQREVFTLRQFGGLKYREIAEVVGVSKNTVKSRMRYALQTLRGHLAAYRDFSFDADEAADARHMR